MAEEYARDASQKRMSKDAVMAWFRDGNKRKRTAKPAENERGNCQTAVGRVPNLSKKPGAPLDYTTIPASSAAYAKVRPQARPHLPEFSEWAVDQGRHSA
jgi:hypothetical protein